MSWLQLRLAITPEQAERLEDELLELGAVSVTFMDAEDQPIFEPDLGTTPLWSNTHLLALFEADTDSDTLIRHLKLLHQGELPAHELEQIEDQDWERSWMDNFHPMQFGKRLWICPSWRDVPDPSAVNVRLDPGLAFGTGTHPTTALCLEWLAAADLTGRHVLDYGCGSGILSIAAAMLGYAPITAFDYDPEAVRVAAENFEINGWADDAIALSVEDVTEYEASDYDVVAANILGHILRANCQRIVSYVRPGGYLMNIAMASAPPQAGAEIFERILTAPTGLAATSAPTVVPSGKTNDAEPNPPFTIALSAPVPAPAVPALSMLPPVPIASTVRPPSVSINPPRQL